MTDYESMYKQKCEEYNSLKLDLDDFQGKNNKKTSQILEQEMEQQIKNLQKQNEEYARKNDALKEDIKKTKQDSAQKIKSLERDLNESSQENESLRNKNLALQRKIIELEVEQENLQNSARQSDSLVQELEQKLDETLEQLAMVQTQLEYSKNQSQDQIERLKQELKDYQEELFATKKQSEMMIERLTKSQQQSPKNLKTTPPKEQFKFDQDWYSKAFDKKTNQVNAQTVATYNENINSLKVNTTGFSKSLNLISNLIKDLDEKMYKIRSQKVN